MSAIRSCVLVLAAAWSAAAHAGEISVTEVWARATAGGARSTAVYFTVTTDQPDTLVGATSPVAAAASLHADVSHDGVMSMRALDAVAVQPRQPMTFRPQGFHLMLERLQGPLREGERFPLTLTFRKAGPITADVAVLKAGATRFDVPRQTTRSYRSEEDHR